MYHILNEPPASVKCRKHSKLCIFSAVYDVHNKQQFSLKNGAAVLNVVGTALLLRVSKNKTCS